jgi:hypothetical protein
MIEVAPGVNVKAEYEKVRKEADVKLKKMFAINNNRSKMVAILVVLLYNAEKGGTLAEMKSLQEALKVQYSLPNNLVCLVEINGKDAKDSVDWSSYPRTIIKNDYKLQPSDPVRIIGDSGDYTLKECINDHRNRIRQAVEDRLKQLCVRYEENNTTKNRFFNFFKSPQTEKSYTMEEVETREIADTLFMLGDYRRALDLYKDLASRFE